MSLVLAYQFASLHSIRNARVRLQMRGRFYYIITHGYIDLQSLAFWPINLFRWVLDHRDGMSGLRMQMQGRFKCAYYHEVSGLFRGPEGVALCPRYLFPCILRWNVRGRLQTRGRSQVWTIA